MGASQSSAGVVVQNINEQGHIETTKQKNEEGNELMVDNMNFAKQIQQHNLNNIGVRRKSTAIQSIAKTEEVTLRVKKQFQPKKAKTLPPLVSERKNIADRALLSLQTNAIENQESQANRCQKDQKLDSKQSSYIDSRKQSLNAPNTQEKMEKEKEYEPIVVFQEIQQNSGYENDRSTAHQRRSKKFRPRRIL